MWKMWKTVTSIVTMLSFVASSTVWGASQGTEGSSGSSTVSAPKASSPSVSNSSKNSNATNMMGAAMNGAMGGLNLYASKKFYSQCSPKNPYACEMGRVFLAMGLMNIAQAGLQLATAKQAGGSYGATSVDGGLGGTGVGGYDSSLVDKVNNDPQFAGNKEYLKQVAKPGGPFSYDPKTGVVTSQDGKKLSASDLKSRESMAAAGLSSDAIASTLDAMKGVEDAAKKKVDKAVEKIGAHTAANGFDESGGGGGGGSALAGADSGAGTGLVGAGGGGLGLDRDPAQVAGMQKDFNGEPIGVAGDSLFKMMTRRYKLKESQNSFFEGSELLTPK